VADLDYEGGARKTGRTTWPRSGPGGTRGSSRRSWSNPAGDHYEQQIGRWSGKDVVQVGARSDGTPTRWMFTEITPDSFHWIGEALQSDGTTWKLEGEFRAKRIR